jgi:hypothetical protein
MLCQVTESWVCSVAGRGRPVDNEPTPDAASAGTTSITFGAQVGIENFGDAQIKSPITSSATPFCSQRVARAMSIGTAALGLPHPVALDQLQPVGPCRFASGPI